MIEDAVNACPTHMLTTSVSPKLKLVTAYSVEASMSGQPSALDVASAANVSATPSTDMDKSSPRSPSASASATGQIASLIANAAEADWFAVICEDTSSSVTLVIPDTLELEAKSTFLI